MAIKSWKVGSVVRASTMALCFGTALFAVCGSAQEPVLAMLDRLEPGLWAIVPQGSTTAKVRICIDNGRKLIQIRHSGQACRQFVIEDSPSTATVQYTCPANGYGHTRLRFENTRLAQVETQGIESGLPFNFSAEARRVGPCRR